MGPRIRTSLLTLLFGVLLGGIFAAPAAASAPALHVDGSVIRDSATGKEFVPHGVDWPSFEYACQQGWGYSNLGASPATAQAMLAWHINTVRIPLNQDCWLGEDGLPESDPGGPELTAVGYQDAVEAFVDDLTAAGIVAIVDLHWSAPPGFEADGLRPMADSRSDDFWKSVARRLKDNPGVIFDLYNEPHSRWDPNKPKVPHGSGIGDWDFKLTWNIWEHGGGSATNHADTEYPFTRPRYPTTGMAALVAAVRSTGATQPIMLSGIDYANDLSEWHEFAPDDDQLIASFHNYPGQRCDDKACWNGEIAELAREVPVITGEIGQADCKTDYITSYMDWADAHHIGYLAWAWWALDDLPAGVLPCSNYALIANLAGDPTPQYGTAYRDHLVSLPETLPPLPKPPKVKTDPKLRVASAWFRNRRLHAEVRLDRTATRAVDATIKIARKSNRRKTRSIGTRIRPVDGRSRFKRSIPRQWVPVKLTVTYAGDKNFLPDRAARQTKVVLDRKH